MSELSVKKSRCDGKDAQLIYQYKPDKSAKFDLLFWGES